MDSVHSKVAHITGSAQCLCSVHTVQGPREGVGSFMAQPQNILHTLFEQEAVRAWAGWIEDAYGRSCSIGQTQMSQCRHQALLFA